MAPLATELATLRALTYRISSTPTSQLPQHVPAIATSLANCRTLLSATQTTGSKNASSETSVAVHKYRTLLSSLLQDRTVQGRWSAIVLIKATVEVGGWETLQKCLPWVRGLLGILTKPDPPSSKALCIITLTRIFLLTRTYPTLIREITTPSLPTFLQACMSIANSKASPKLLLVVLESFNQLLPRHPTLFRSYLKQLQPLLAHLIAPTPSSKISQEEVPQSKPTPSSQISAVARQLYVQVPCCAPKGASGEEWSKSLKSTINNANHTADKVFRAVIEDWQPTSRHTTAVNGQSLDDEVQCLEQDSLGLPPWSGIFAGGERLNGLLNLVKEQLRCPTAIPVHLNIGAIMDLITRTLSLTLPGSSSKEFQNTVKLNNQVSREERENLWLLLPQVHSAAIELLLALIDRTQACTLSLDALIIDQLIWVFKSEKDIARIRVGCYMVVTKLLRRSGATLPKSTIDSLVPLIRACCEDLLSSHVSSSSVVQTQTPAKINGNMPLQSVANADTFLDSSKSVKDSIAGCVGLLDAASDLLPALLANVRAQYFSDSLRARLDRTAILIQHKDAMTASVLNPPPSKKFGKPAASILPLLARSFPEEYEVESMLRPRMPVIRLGGQDLEGTDASGNEEEEEEDSTGVYDDPDDDINGRHLVEEHPDTVPEVTGQAEPALQDLVMADSSEVSIPNIAADPNTLAATSQDQPLSTTRLPRSIDASKRTFGDNSPDSSSKRVKTGEREQLSISQPSFVPATSTSPNISAADSPIPVVSAPANSTTASSTPKLPDPVHSSAHEGESDEDDIGILVLGPDTDEESE